MLLPRATCGVSDEQLLCPLLRQRVRGLPAHSADNHSGRRLVGRSVPIRIPGRREAARSQCYSNPMRRTNPAWDRFVESVQIHRNNECRILIDEFQMPGHESKTTMVFAERPNTSSNSDVLPHPIGMKSLFWLSSSFALLGRATDQKYTSASLPFLGYLSWLPASTRHQCKETDHGTYRLVPRPATAILPGLHGADLPDLRLDRLGMGPLQRHRFITEVIFSSGNVGNGHWSRFHRFFSHAAWDIDTFSLFLAKLVMTILARAAPSTGRSTTPSVASAA